MMKYFNFKLIPVFFSLMLTFNLFASERFFVNIRGSKAQIESVKKRSEYRMTKNVDFCRGVKMPKPISGWRCQGRGEQAFCSQEYECHFVDKKFNRKNESLRTYRAMKTMPAITAGYSIALSAKPQAVPNQLKTKPVAAKQVLKPVATPVPVSTPNVEEDLLAEFEEVMPKEKPQEVKDDFFEESFAEEKPTSEKNEVSESSASTWNWLRFDGYFTQTSDEAGSQSALEAGWRPRWNFNPRWSLEARLGMSQRTPVAGSEEEAFSVLETGAWLGRRFGNWNLSGGFGRQSWGGEGVIGSQTPTFYSFGVAYYWSDIKLHVVEAIEFQYLSLSDEGGSSAMRLGFLINF